MFNKEIYENRRNNLRKNIGEGIILILGNNNSPMNYSGNIYPFRQDSNFLYYFGIDHPGFAAILDVDEDKDIIFADDFSIDDIIWMGPQDSVRSQAANVGVEHTMTSSELHEYVKRIQKKGRTIHFTPPYRHDNMLKLEKMLAIRASEITKHASVELIKAIVAQRSIKEAVEIEHIEAIMDIAYEMHTTAMAMACEGIYEYEIAGAVEGVAMQRNGRTSFPVILSKRGETLHNEYHGNKLEDGDLLLCDMGYESPMRYATDHTRTYPVSGKFTQKQKEIYNIVLAANNAVHREAKPGIAYREMHMLACRTIAYGLKELGLMKGNIEEAVAAGAHALFMPHGLGHMMGLDVHDMEDLGENYVGYSEEIKRSSQFGTAYLRLGRKLEPGFVITNEPGIYFIPALIDKWEKEGLHKDFIDYKKVNKYREFGGIRLEDDMLITGEGSRNLGEKRIPIEVDEIESLVGSYWKD
jgi:Xaa-Pro aminopeptidase